jgi:hypothetical protein
MTTPSRRCPRMADLLASMGQPPGHPEIPCLSTGSPAFAVARWIRVGDDLAIAPYFGRAERSAAIHKLAAEVELATPEHERWVVETETLYEGRGRVYLELADGTPAEAERGMAMLKKLPEQSRQPGDATGSLSHG